MLLVRLGPSAKQWTTRLDAMEAAENHVVREDKPACTGLSESQVRAATHHLHTPVEASWAFVKQRPTGSPGDHWKDRGQEADSA